MHKYNVTVEDLNVPYEDKTGFYGMDVTVEAENCIQAMQEGVPKAIALMNADNPDWNEEDKYTFEDELKVTVEVERKSKRS